MLKVLFITSSSEYTGSEIALYNLVNNLDKTKVKPIGWVSKFNGQLIKDIPGDIPCFILEQYLRKAQFLVFLFINNLFSIKSLSTLKESFKSFLAYVDQFIKADIWYINTILQPDVLEYAYEQGIPCIVHAHELEQMLINLTAEDIEKLITYPKLIIACSKTSAKMLEILGRDKNLEVSFPTIDTNKISKIKFDSESLRESLGIDKSSFIWCMSGTADPNKDPVRFINIAYQILKRDYDCHFVWLGNNPNSGLSVFAEKYANHLGIKNKITWSGFLIADQYYKYLNLADGFILTSTKESFSIVAIEALYLGKPVVSFNCGGIQEIIQEKLGHIVDSWNIEDIVETMIKVMLNKNQYDPTTAKIESEKYDIQIQVKKWQIIINNYS